MKTTIKTTTTIFATLALTLGLMFTSCKKGDTGPAGEKGTDGKNGSSNIQTSTYTLTSANWSYNSVDNSYDATISVAGITSSVVNSGSIQLFINNTTGSATEWAAMPFSLSNVQMNYSYQSGLVKLSATLSGAGTPGNPGTTSFKVVVIPPGMVKTNVNTHSYAAIKEAYNLKD